MCSKHSSNTPCMTPSPSTCQITKAIEETLKSTCPIGHLLTKFPVTSFLQLHETPLFHNRPSGSFFESLRPWLIPFGEKQSFNLRVAKSRVQRLKLHTAARQRSYQIIRFQTHQTRQAETRAKWRWPQQHRGDRKAQGNAPSSLLKSQIWIKRSRCYQTQAQCWVYPFSSREAQPSHPYAGNNSKLLQWVPCLSLCSTF